MLKIVLACAFAVFSLFSSWAKASPLEYSFAAPYQGAGAISIYNNTDQNIIVTQLEFDVNAEVASTYGALSSYTSTLTKEKNSDSTMYHYTLNEGKNPITIAAHNKADVTYTFSNQLGPLPIGTNASNIKLNNQLLDIQGMCQGAACNDPTPGKRIIGYYSDWDQYGIGYLPAQIPVDKANTIHYSFVNYDTKGQVILFDPYADSTQIPAIATLRQQHPYLNASLSFGGWTLSSNFSALARDPVATDNFVKNAVAAMKEAHFNGIDIDWEYPVAGSFNKNSGTIDPGQSDDAANYAALLTKLRAKLDEQGSKDNKKYFLTIAAPAGVDKIQGIQNSDPTAWKKITTAVDYVDVMAYDFHGSWDSYTDFMSAMALDPEKDPSAKDPITKQYAIHDAMDLYQKLGVPAQKIVLGIPAYGRMSNVAQLGGNNLGLYQQITGTPLGEYDQNGEMTGMFDYKCIVDTTQCKLNGAALLSGLVLVDSSNPLAKDAHTPWGYIPGKNQFITFDDATSTAYKADWIVSQHYAGAMFWEFSGDLNGNNPKSLVNVVYQVFKRS